MSMSLPDAAVHSFELVTTGQIRGPRVTRLDSVQFTSPRVLADERDHPLDDSDGHR